MVVILTETKNPRSVGIPACRYPYIVDHVWLRVKPVHDFIFKKGAAAANLYQTVRPADPEGAKLRAIERTVVNSHFGIALITLAYGRLLIVPTTNDNLVRVCLPEGVLVGEGHVAIIGGLQCELYIRLALNINTMVSQVDVVKVLRRLNTYHIS